MRPYLVIKDASTSVIDVKGEQVYNTSVEYRVSDFTLTEKISESSSEILYYSCLTGEMLLVNNISESLDYLVKRWFLVPVNERERESADKLQRIMSCLWERTKSPGYDDYEILTTTTCNANCFYCYEQGFKKNTMTDLVSKEVAKFIKNNWSKKTVRIKWYGGEPLMNTDAIDIISRELINSSIPFVSVMVSNGLLFTQDRIEKAYKLWNLKSVRITIDGTEEVYNRTKSYRNKTISPYLVVSDNIDKLMASGIKVSLRLNVEIHNMEDAEALVDSFIRKFKGSEFIDFSIKWLCNTEVDNHVESSGKDREIVIQRVLTLRDRLFNAGFNVDYGELPRMCKHLCKADSKHHLLIKPDGGFSFCAQIFNKQSYGNIFTNPTGTEVPPLFLDTFEKGGVCDSCPLYASCILSKSCPAKLLKCDEKTKQRRIANVKLAMAMKYRSFKRSLV